MINLGKFLFLGFLVWFGFSPILAQKEEPDDAAVAQPRRPPRRMGYSGLRVWRAHHGSLRSTFSSTQSVGQLVQYSGGIETSRSVVSITRYYPNRLRLEMQVGVSTRILIFDGTNVTAEQGPPPTPSEIDLVIMLAKNSVEWIFGQVGAGAIFRLQYEAVAPEDFDAGGGPRNIPRAYDALELLLPGERMLVFAHRNTGLIEVMRRWGAGRDIRVEFSGWQSVSGIRLPYGVGWTVNGERRAALILAQITTTIN